MKNGRTSARTKGRRFVHLSGPEVWNRRPLIWVCPLLLLAVVTTGSCSAPPDPAVVEKLTSALWHAQVGEDDYVYELNHDGRDFGGRLHRVTRGRHENEIPVTGVTIRGAAIEIGNAGFPPFKGEMDLDGGRIVGGVAAEPQFRDMNLTRAEKAQWPMIRLRVRTEPAGDPYRWTRPVEDPDDWVTAEPAEVGIELNAVEATVKAVLEGEAAALHSLLVVRDGKLVVEEYFHGWSPDDLHGVLSCTKSVASLLVGIAIDQGRLSGVDVPLLDFFPGYEVDAAEGWEAIRLEHQLTMTMGLDWSGHGESWHANKEADRFAMVFGHPLISPPGRQMKYVGSGADLLSGVLLEATGTEADLFAEENLFGPLGIVNWDWSYRRWQGHPDSSAGLSLRPRDMAKLGQLVLDGGSWEGRQVVSAGWIRESTRTHVSETPYGLQYGYLWWRVDPPPEDMPLGVVSFANGIGSQFVAVVPDARIVIVTTGGNPLNGRQFDIVRVAQQYLLPGVSIGG